MYTCQQTQTAADPCGVIFTVGRHNNGRWLPESDWGTEEEARDRADALNAVITAIASAAPAITVTPDTLALAMAAFDRKNPIFLIPLEPRAADEWPAGDPSMEFPRTYERIRRESPEEYRELVRRRESEFQADFAARLPKG